ncbi:hypothetical protein PY650_33890 [Rhizobium calliandrae]|uniref:Uncharacterized protein n=1 Tax=Rhizobium calliandrae TaxID=1312182 RepID=A0ABT7KPC2_9HYPH|nr:hypothetical protein [Rhizobium calliandrae]MDL2410485.1 hypothetical protein [Rhizobium calliandrae]
MSEYQEATMPNQPQRSRAVFSQEDFELIRVAIAHYLHEVEGQRDAVKYSNLYHRLGRIG